MIRFLVQHKMVDVIVSTGGGIEEDFIKCMSNTYPLTAPLTFLSPYTLPILLSRFPSYHQNLFILLRQLRHVGDFNLAGAGLRAQGLNRIGNLIVPNDNYCKFEEWLLPILDKAVEEQKTLVCQRNGGGGGEGRRHGEG